jgi:hypothetical protein
VIIMGRRGKSAKKFPGLRSMSDLDLDKRYSMAKDDFYKSNSKSPVALAREIVKEKNYRRKGKYSLQ